MGRKTTQYVVLGVLGVILAVVLGYQFWWRRAPQEPTATLPAGAPEAVARPQPAQARRAARGPLEVPDVKLSALAAAKAAPDAEARNPFRVKPPPPPPPPVMAQPAVPAVNPDEPPPPPPITLKYIGLVNAGPGIGRVAILASGQDVFYGREGDIVDGRYKIVSIGAESIVVSYADGRGSRRIAISGS